MMKHQNDAKVSPSIIITASRYLLAVFVIGLLIITKLPRGLSALLNNIGSVSLNQALLSSAGEQKAIVQFTEAGLDFQKALASDGRNGYTYYNLGTIYTHFEDMASAHDAFSKAVATLPEDAISLFQLGMTKSKRNDEEGALALWQQAGAAPYFVNSSQEFTNEGDLESALQDAQRAIAIDPTIIPAYFVLAEVYSKQEDYSSALQAYQTAVTVAPDSAAGLYHVGLMYDRLEQLDKAINYYRRALLQHPPYTPALRNLANIYAKQSECEQVDAVLHEVLYLKSNIPFTASALRIVSACYIKTQKPDTAKPYLEQLVSLDTANSNDFTQLARVYEALDRHADAIDVYKYILLIDPNYEEAQEGLTRLKGEDQ